MKNRKKQKIKMIFLIVLISVYFIFEIVMGFETNSIALISDAYNMLSDLISVVIGLVCLILSNKTWHKSTFGWARAEVMGALVNSIFMIAISISIFTNSIERLINPEDIKHPWLLLGVGLGGLVVDGIGLVLFLGDAKGNDENGDDDDESLYDEDLSKPFEHCQPVYQGGSMKENLPQAGELSVEIEEIDIAPITKSGGTMNIQAMLLHIFGDFLGSVVVVTSALVVLFADFSQVNRIDPILSMLMVAVMLGSTIPIFKQSARVMLQSLPDKMDVPKLTNDLNAKIKGLRGIHDMHVWQLVGSKLIASLHINCKDVTEYENMSGQLRMFFHSKGICSTTIQPEFTELKHRRSSSNVNTCSLDSRSNSIRALKISRNNSKKSLVENNSNPSLTTLPLKSSSSSPQFLSVDAALTGYGAGVSRV